MSSSRSSIRRSSLTRPKTGSGGYPSSRRPTQNPEREERRRTVIERKPSKSLQQQERAHDDDDDAEFMNFIKDWRDDHKGTAEPRTACSDRICICVRKRPLSSDKDNDFDCVTCLHPNVWVHSAKLRVDGITKYLDHNSFRFDHAFDETVETNHVYSHSTMPLVDFVCKGEGGRATVFAYGQTGSGKTYTMEGIQTLVAEDVFLLLEEQADSKCSLQNTMVTLAFFEIYGPTIQDLLHNRHKLKVLENGKGEVVVSGLQEFEVHDPDEFMSLLEKGNSLRTTHATEANDTSSRSHAICQVCLRSKSTSALKGKLSLVDLAGSERGNDTKSHNSKRRSESADINTSLLSLKECIRALDAKSRHVPYRGSKLTMLLKDCFTSPQALTTVIATVSPAASSSDHTLNTLRYANRIKENKVQVVVGTRTPLTSLRPVVTASSNRQEVVEIEDNDKDNDDSFEDQVVVSGEEQTGEMKMTPLRIAEEELLDLHMTNIQKNAELLKEESTMMKGAQHNTIATNAEMDTYASQLSAILEQKTDMIYSLQQKMNIYRTHLEASK